MFYKYKYDVLHICTIFKKEVILKKGHSSIFKFEVSYFQSPFIF